MMQSSFDAIIVGAGPAGASAAILLSKAGLSVALVEKQAFPRRKVCGDCVSASNLPLLDGLGIDPLAMAELIFNIEDEFKLKSLEIVGAHRLTAPLAATVKFDGTERERSGVFLGTGMGGTNSVLALRAAH